MLYVLNLFLSVFDLKPLIRCWHQTSVIKESKKIVFRIFLPKHQPLVYNLASELPTFSLETL